jgi:hypothetical protein
MSRSASLAPTPTTFVILSPNQANNVVDNYNKVSQAQEGDYCSVGPSTPIPPRSKTNFKYSCFLSETEYPLRNYMRGMPLWIMVMLAALHSGKVIGTASV